MGAYVFPYSIAVGIWNFIFTIIIAFVAKVCFSVDVTWDLLWKSYLCGYVFLWLVNLHIIAKIK